MDVKRRLEETVSRLSAFYGGKAEDRIFARMDIRNRKTDFYERIMGRLPPASRGLLPDIEIVYSIWEEYLSPLYELEDDSVPTIYLNQYDQGLYGALLGAEMMMNRMEEPGWFSSITRPLEHFVPEEWEWKEGNPWIKRFKQDLEYVAEMGRERFGIGVVITIDALNFLVQVLGGTKGLLCIHRHPQEAERLMEFALQLNIKLVELQRGVINVSYEGGVFDYFGGWLPNQSVPMSVDCYNFCRPRIYVTMGRSHHQRLIDHFGGGIFHVHGNGRHLLPEMAKLRGVMAVTCTDDGSPRRAFEIVKKLKRQVGGIPLIVDCTEREFLRGLKDRSLEGGVMYCLEVESVSEGNNIMKKVRRYRV